MSSSLALFMTQLTWIWFDDDINSLVGFLKIMNKMHFYRNHTAYLYKSQGYQ